MDDPPRCNSIFKLTFTIEIINTELLSDCKEEFLELGQCEQGIKINYQLYPGQSFELDVLIWPHVVKIWCGSQFGWVRTWLFLERKWFTFSIRHTFPVRVEEMKNFCITVSPLFGLAGLSANAKSDKSTEVYLPPLQFGERRYFGRVTEEAESFERILCNLIWSRVERSIPASCFDGEFDKPHEVTDVRHQDAVLYRVQDLILNGVYYSIDHEPAVAFAELSDTKKKDSKKVEVSKPKFEIRLPGETLLAGAGRLVQCEIVGEKPIDVGEMIVLVSTENLPADDDYPIFFVNIDKLFDVPLEKFKKHRITHLFTRWTLNGVEYDSEIKALETRREFNFKSHRVVPLEYEMVFKVPASMLDDPFKVEIRGLRTIDTTCTPNLFGYGKRDSNFGFSRPAPPKNESVDFLIAVTKIDAKLIAQGRNTFITAEYPLYPPTRKIEALDRDPICTNDVNAIGRLFKPDLVVPAHVVLESQMLLEVSIGLVGCKPQRLYPCYSRLYCLIQNSNIAMEILKTITDINEEISMEGLKEDILSGFGVDLGDVLFLYVEGPRDKQILRIWNMSDDFYPEIKPLFSSSSKYATRVYPESLISVIPFYILKMTIPLSVLLACPPVYARPALPSPARSAVLKFGRIVSSKLTVIPNRCEMPTAEELKSFRLELCTPQRTNADTNTTLNHDLKIIPIVLLRRSLHHSDMIHWDKKPC